MVQSAFRLFNISRNGSGKGVTVAQSLKDHVRQRVSLSLVYAALVCVSEAASNSVWKRPAWQDDAGRLVFFKNTGHTLLARFRSSAEGR